MIKKMHRSSVDGENIEGTILKFRRFHKSSFKIFYYGESDKSHTICVWKREIIWANKWGD